MVDAYAAARDFVRRSYPHARIAFLGGSAASGTTTSTSDLDIFVLLDHEGDVSYVETTTHEGWLVEAFVYSPDAVQRWLQKGRDERRPVLDALAATGLALTDNDETQAWAERARAVLAAGPGEPDPEEVDVRRYTLSALLDDLEGADPGERYVVAATAFREAAELTLLVQRRWLGSGKWLVRNLRSADDHGLVAWAAGVHDPAELAAICRAVLTAAGGYLQSGFVRGERPRPPST